MASNSSNRGNSFPTTRWSCISLLREAKGEQRNAVLGPFLQRYRPALAEFLRFKLAIRDEHDREDLVQGFLADRLIGKDILRKARAERGKLRSYILASLVNYVRDQQRTLAYRHRSVATSWGADPVIGSVQPDLHAQVFDALWAREVTAQALDRMREECVHKQRQHVWTIFTKRVLDPIDLAVPAPAYAELAGAMHLSATQVKNYLVTAKRAYQRHLHEVIDEYTIDEDETRLEIKTLRRALASGIHAGRH